LDLLRSPLSLNDLKSDRVLRWWDFVAIIATTVAGIYSSRAFGALAYAKVSIAFEIYNSQMRQYC